MYECNLIICSCDNSLLIVAFLNYMNCFTMLLVKRAEIEVQTNTAPWLYLTPPPWTRWPPFWQTTFSNAFCWMKLIELRFKFHWNLFQCANWRFASIDPGNGLAPLNISLKFVSKVRIFNHWFNWWLSADQASSHYRNQLWLVYWHLYTSLGFNELTHRSHAWPLWQWEKLVITFLLVWFSMQNFWAVRTTIGLNILWYMVNGID